MKLSGAEIVIRTLLEHGCDTVFGYPGSNVLPLYDSLYEHKREIRHVLTAHEQGAAHAADGYARATGKPGVVLATSGPGATNLVTGIAAAHLDSVPMIALCGNVPTHQIGTDSFQEIDITGITLPITKHNYFVSHVEELAETVREAFWLARSGRPGPVLIDIPKDVQTAMWEYTPASPRPLPLPHAAAEHKIATAARAMEQAQRPYIYFGGGIVSADASAELMALAERLDAPLGCSFMGLSAVPSNHPRFLGMQGMHGHTVSNCAMKQADVIVALGVRFNDRVLGETGAFSPRATLIQVDTDNSELSKILPAHHSLHGDVKATLEALLQALPQKAHPDWQKELAGFRKKEKRSSENGMTPEGIVETVNSFLTPRTPVATDVGQHQMWAAQYLHLQSPRCFLSSGGLGAMGFGIGAAMGAAMATGERTVLLTGDGSLGMSLQELATAVTYQVPLVIVLFRNGTLGLVRQWQTVQFSKRYSSSTLDRKTDFVALIRAFGGDGQRAESLEQLKSALCTAFSANGPYLIDCPIDADACVAPDPIQ